MSEATATTGRIAGFRSALGESPPLLWSFLYFFCLLSGYYVLRPVREAMVAAQLATAERLPMADDVLFNDVSLARLEANARRLFAIYQSMAA